RRRHARPAEARRGAYRGGDELHQHDDPEPRLPGSLRRDGRARGGAGGDRLHRGEDPAAPWLVAGGLLYPLGGVRRPRRPHRAAQRPARPGGRRRSEPRGCLGVLRAPVDPVEPRPDGFLDRSDAYLGGGRPPSMSRGGPRCPTIRTRTTARRTPMGKLTVTTHISLDGVMQAPGGPEEDTSGGFPHGGWTVPHVDEEGSKFIAEVFQRADAFLLG